MRNSWSCLSSRRVLSPLHLTHVAARRPNYPTFGRADGCHVSQPQWSARCSAAVDIIPLRSTPLPHCGLRDHRIRPEPANYIVPSIVPIPDALMRLGRLAGR